MVLYDCISRPGLVTASNLVVIFYDKVVQTIEFFNLEIFELKIRTEQSILQIVTASTHVFMS